LAKYLLESVAQFMHKTGHRPKPWSEKHTNKWSYQIFTIAASVH